jgi:DNA-binding NarL/FixJ family response regulator
MREENSNMNKLRVFLADDHAIVRQGIKSLVSAQADMQVVGEAADGQAAIDAVAQTRPDVAILDISLPGMTGVELAQRLQKEAPKVKLLALTLHEGSTFLRQFMQSGGSGYVLKRTLTDELLRAIRTVAEGGIFVDPALVTQPRKKSTGGTPELSEREEEVLRLIAEGHTNQEIALRFDLSAKTVETYKTRSLVKLGLKTRADIVRHAIREGWLAET